MLIKDNKQFIHRKKDKCSDACFSDILVQNRCAATCLCTASPATVFSVAKRNAVTSGGYERTVRICPTEFGFCVAKGYAKGK